MATTLARGNRDARAFGFLKLAILTAAAESSDAVAPTITAGAGAPSASEVDASLYIDITNDVLYMRQAGAWGIIAGAGADFGSTGISADVIDESATAAGVTVDGVLLKDGGATFADGSVVAYQGAGTSGDVIRRIGASATEGLELVVFENTISPSAVETAVFTVPAGAVIRSVQANVETALTGGGTTVTFALGTTGDPDKYGYPGSDTLAQNAKIDTIPDWAVLGSAEAIVLTGAATGGTADGDTALTVGSVRVRIVYEQLNSLDNA